MSVRRNTVVATGAAVVAAMLLAGRVLAADVTPELGVWQLHQLNFDYLGFTSTYSCDGLADKLRLLLLRSGARADVMAQPGVCAASQGVPDKFARARLSFYTLTPRSTAGASGEAGQGQWQSVDLTARHPLELQLGDCELVEQFRDRVLKKMFTVRNLNDGTTCIPHQESGSLIDLRFESFAPLPGAPQVIKADIAPPRVFAYPKQGQTQTQLTSDRAACESAAAKQSGYEPAAPAADAAAAKAQAYSAALAACLEGRGYSVR